MCGVIGWTQVTWVIAFSGLIWTSYDQEGFQDGRDNKMAPCGGCNNGDKERQRDKRGPSTAQAQRKKGQIINKADGCIPKS